MKCSRYRCKHQVFGDIRVQEKWALGKEVSKRVSHGVEWQDQNCGLSLIQAQRIF